jgi:hypothetical protein
MAGSANSRDALTFRVLCRLHGGTVMVKLKIVLHLSMDS